LRSTGQPVAARQAEIEHHQVVVGRRQRRLGHRAVAHPVHGVMLGPQRIEHRFADHGVVFDQEEPHGRDCAAGALKWG
jgi:hypothetical protein